MRVYLLREHVLLRLQCVAVLQALVAAGLCVASVLERAALLLEAHHLVLADAAQVSVELAHRQAHQLLVREALIDPALPRTWDTHTEYVVTVTSKTSKTCPKISGRTCRCPRAPIFRLNYLISVIWG